MLRFYSLTQEQEQEQEQEQQQQQQQQQQQWVPCFLQPPFKLKGLSNGHLVQSHNHEFLQELQSGYCCGGLET